MERLELDDAMRADIRRVWSLAPGLGEAWLQLSDRVYDESRLSPREREAARMRIAQINQCQLCLAVRFPGQGVDEALYAEVERHRGSDAFSPREALAIEFAERFATDHLSLDDAFFSRLRRHFANDEVLELGLCVATWLAQGRLTQVLGLDRACGLTRAGSDGRLDPPAA